MILLNSRHDGVDINIRHHQDIYWWKLGYNSMNQVSNPVWILCALEKNIARCMYISSTPIYSGSRCSPTVDSQSLNILMSLSVLRFALTFFISAVQVFSMLPRLSCLLTCHNDVIDVGQNNRLFSPSNDMYQELLRLSHMQKGIFYVHICDKCTYYINACKMMMVYTSQIW